MLPQHGASFCTKPHWWANGWCFASRGPAGSQVQDELVLVQWDCTAHIMPYLNYLHKWLLKVGATMPSLSSSPQLAAPVEVRIDHALLQANQDCHETWHKEPPDPKHKEPPDPNTQVQETN